MSDSLPFVNLKMIRPMKVLDAYFNIEHVSS